MRVRAFCLALLVPSLACGSDAAAPCEATYPTAPESAPTTTLHVSTTCGSADGTGAGDAPFASISQALLAATPSTTILVEAGTYAENLYVDVEDLWLVGSSAGSGAEAAGILLQAPSPEVAVYVGGGAQDVRLRGLHVQAATIAGVWFDAVAGGLEASLIDGVTADEDGKFGFGVLATDALGILLQSDRLVVEGNIVSGAEAAGIILQRVAGDVVANQVSGAKGGIRVESSPDTVVVEGNTVSDVTEVGVLVLGSDAQVIGNTIAGVSKTDTAPYADGIVLTRPEDIDGTHEHVVEGNEITDVGRAGVLAGRGAGGRISSNVVHGAGFVGILLQLTAGAVDHGGDLGVLVQDNDIAEATGAAISVVAGARATVRGNSVAATQPVEAFVGLASDAVADGVGVFSGAVAHVRDNSFDGIDRTEILFDAPADGCIVGPQSAPVGIILQHGAPDALVVEGAVSVEYPADDQALVVSEDIVEGVSLPSTLETGGVGPEAPGDR